jgi:hypothetical protein
MMDEYCPYARPDPEIKELFRKASMHLEKCDTCGAPPINRKIYPCRTAWNKMVCMPCHMVEANTYFHHSIKTHKLPENVNWATSKHKVPATDVFPKAVPMSELYAKAIADAKAFHAGNYDYQKSAMHPLIGFCYDSREDPFMVVHHQVSKEEYMKHLRRRCNR